MDLPPEIRHMIYRKIYNSKRVTFNYSNTGSRCFIFESRSWNLPPLTHSREIYREQKALYLSCTQFHLHSIPILKKFLKMIGPEGRKLLTSVSFRYSNHSISTTFQLLRECTELRSLAVMIRIQASPYRHDPHRLMKKKGLNQLLRIRGINCLDLRDIKVERTNVHYTPPPGVDVNTTLRSIFNADRDRFINELQVLKLPRPEPCVWNQPALVPPQTSAQIVPARVQPTPVSAKIWPAAAPMAPAQIQPALIPPQTRPAARIWRRLAPASTRPAAAQTVSAHVQPALVPAQTLHAAAAQIQQSTILAAQQADPGLVNYQSVPIPL